MQTDPCPILIGQSWLVLIEDIVCSLIVAKKYLTALLTSLKYISVVRTLLLISARLFEEDRLSYINIFKSFIGEINHISYSSPKTIFTIYEHFCASRIFIYLFVCFVQYSSWILKVIDWLLRALFLLFISWDLFYWV